MIKLDAEPGTPEAQKQITAAIALAAGAAYAKAERYCRQRLAG